MSGGMRRCLLSSSWLLDTRQHTGLLPTRNCGPKCQAEMEKLLESRFQTLGRADWRLSSAYKQTLSSAPTTAARLRDQVLGRPERGQVNKTSKPLPGHI